MAALVFHGRGWSGPRASGRGAAIVVAVDVMAVLSGVSCEFSTVASGSEFAGILWCLQEAPPVVVHFGVSGVRAKN